MLSSLTAAPSPPASESIVCHRLRCAICWWIFSCDSPLGLGRAVLTTHPTVSDCEREGDKTTNHPNTRPLSPRSARDSFRVPTQYQRKTKKKIPPPASGSAIPIPMRILSDRPWTPARLRASCPSPCSKLVFGLCCIDRARHVGDVLVMPRTRRYR